MNYKSTIKLLNNIGFDHSMIANVETATLLSAIQRTMDDSADSFVRVGEESYMKKDLEQLIALDTFKERLTWELAIKEDANFLLFLEKGPTKLSYLKNATQFKNPDFIELFSPELTSAFHFHLDKKIQSNEWLRVEDLMKLDYLILEENKAKAFEPLVNFFDKSLDTMKQLTDLNFNENKDELSAWIHFNWGDFLNNLPVLIRDYANRLAFGLTHVVMIAAKKDVFTAQKISRYLTQLIYIEENIKSVIKRNDKKVNVESEEVKGHSNRGLIISIIFIILFVARIILRLSNN